jgi:hypothetical protein
MSENGNSEVRTVWFRYDGRPATYLGYEVTPAGNVNIRVRDSHDDLEWIVNPEQLTLTDPASN